ncbi:MAG TPA: (2Fe-2S) ferredoxin domain-containing protein [Nitrospiria bacterium]|nr:(2Fe-2S) ferredoxin domain-containing protein [Nitrospiria bacterium]
MPKPKYHIIVCTTTRPPGNPKGSCGEKGSRDYVPLFFEEMEKHNLFGQVLITESSCLGPCPIGPTMVVYPDGTWYRGVKAQDIPEIMKEHIVNGNPVKRLMIPDEMWG